MFLNDWWQLRQLLRQHSRFRIFYQYWYRRQMLRHAANIMPRAEFASKPTLPHGLSGIFISSGVRIGRNAVIFHQVTIGTVTTIDSSHRGSPVIGDNCLIGAGAKIIGNIRIGNNVRIGANAVVHRDVPDNAIVTSGAQQVRICASPPDNRYVFNREGVWYQAQDGEYLLCPDGGAKPVCPADSAETASSGQQTV